MKGSFEDRFTALAGEEGVKAAKLLLKQNRLPGAWYDESGVLHGIFTTDGEPVECRVTSGDPPRCECSCGSAGFCAHGVALFMYSGRFHRPEFSEPLPNYCKGLRRDSCEMLMKTASGDHPAELWLDALHLPPHVPSKWEYLVLKVKVRCCGREYMGNLSNLRQLYFDKFLSAVVKWETLPLHDRQLVRFLALNGEAENSNVILNSENTAEFFHSLTGFSRFLRDGRPITMRSERGEPVLLEHGGEMTPGIQCGSMLCPTRNAQVIAGRSGCWVGCSGDYFFVPARCEVNMLRSFFSSTPQRGSAAEFRGKFPFPVIQVKNGGEPAKALMHPYLDGIFNQETRTLHLKTGFFYPDTCGTTVLCQPETGALSAGKNGTWLRDREAEIRFLDQLAMSGFTRRGEHAELTGTESCGIFLARVLPSMMKQPHPPVLGPDLQKLYDTPDVVLHCAFDHRTEESFILRFSLKSGDRDLEFECCRKAAEQHAAFIGVPPCGVAAIPSALGQFLRSCGTLFRTIDQAGGTWELPFANADFYNALTKELPEAAVPEIQSGAPCASVTAAGFRFTGTLRPYQNEGVEFLRRMTDRSFNPLLADEMGLGKTVQLIALLSSRSDRNSAPNLIVCPSSLLVNWEREINRFSPDMRVGIPTTDRKKFWQEAAKNYDVIVTSYTLVRLDSVLMRNEKFNFVVLDEAQHIKNPASANAKCCKVLRAGHRVVLTGTPLENGSADLWSIFDFLQPGMLGTLPEFKRRYAEISGNKELQEELKMRISPFLCRRTKQEVAKDLPPRTEQLIFCDMSAEQRTLYNRILTAGRKELAGFQPDDKRVNASIFNLLLRLRQVCCHPALLPENQGENIPSVKTDLFMELIQRNIDSRHKVLVFSQFTSLLALLKKALKGAGIRFEYLDGATADRQERVDRFNNTPEIPVFLLSLKAGGTGLNLCSADSVLIFDPWWNPAAEMQAADRAHRIGQTRAVTIAKLVVRNSIEEQILSLQGRKKEIFDAVIAADQMPEKLSAAALRSLIEEK